MTSLAHLHDAPPGLSPWLTMKEGAEYARCLGKDGDPTDRFYAAIKRHLGPRRKVRAEELDDLIERGAL